MKTFHKQFASVLLIFLTFFGVFQEMSVSVYAASPEIENEITAFSDLGKRFEGFPSGENPIAAVSDGKNHVELAEHDIYIKMGGTVVVKPTVTVASGVSRNLVYDISDESVISFDPSTFKVKGLKPGISIIYFGLEEKPEEVYDYAYVTVMFKDVAKKSAYYFDSVYRAVYWGVTSGYTDSKGKPTGYFGPDDVCTRGQVVTFLARYFELDTVPNGAPEFTDVKSSDYFYKPVRIMAALGVTGGYTDSNGNPTGKFGPNDKCTRGQVVTFLYRIAKILELDQIDTSSVKNFSDVKSDAFYYDAVRWAVAAGITTGYSGSNKFGPNDKCTRAQVVTFICRFDDFLGRVSES